MSRHVLLIDENMESAELLALLSSAGIEFDQVKRVIREGASDDEIIDFAREKNLIIVTDDKDINGLLQKRNFDFPSVIWTRTRQTLTVAQIVKTIKSILKERSEKPNGFIAIITPQNARIRDLPIKR